MIRKIHEERCQDWKLAYGFQSGKTKRKRKKEHTTEIYIGIEVGSIEISEGRQRAKLNMGGCKNLK